MIFVLKNYFCNFYFFLFYIIKMVILKHDGKTDGNTELTDNGIKNTSQALELISNGDTYKLPTTSGNASEVLSLGVVPSNLFWKDITCPSPTLTTPFTIADRGIPNVLPENSILGFEYVVKNGLYQIGISVQKTRDNKLAVMYDTTVDRTTTSSGNVADLLGVQFEDLSMEVGSATRNITNYYVGTLKPPSLDDVFENFDKTVWYFIQSIDDSLIECYEKAEQFGIEKQCVFRSTNYSQILSLLSSYPDAITSWIAGTDTTKSPSSILSDTILYIEVDPSISGTYLTQCNTDGLDWIVYNINTQKDYNDFLTLGATGFLSEDPLYVSNTHTKLTIDPYRSGKWYGGTFNTKSKRPPEIINGALKIEPLPIPSGTSNKSMIMGWACPIPNPSGTYTISVDFTVGNATNGGVSIGVSFCCLKDDYFISNTSSQGYSLLHRWASPDAIQLFKRNLTSGGFIANNSSGDFLNAGTTGTFVIQVSPTSITCSVNGNTITVNDTDFRGPYFALFTDQKSITWDMRFSNITIT